MKTAIPKFLAHLPVSEKGYPVPFFAPFVGGKPDFRLMDGRKWKACAERGLCSICGKKLNVAKYFITGPLGLKNGVQSDPPMHRHCALYSIQYCPHLASERASRRDIPGIEANAFQVEARPEMVFLIKTRKAKPDSSLNIFKFKPEAFWQVPYSGGKVDIGRLHEIMKA